MPKTPKTKPNRVCRLLVLFLLVVAFPHFAADATESSSDPSAMAPKDAVPRHRLRTSVRKHKNATNVHSSDKKAHRSIATESPNPLSESEIKEMKTKIESLKDQIDMLQAEMEVMRAESRALIQRTQLGFLNEFYLKGGISVIVPRGRTFGFKTDTGIGAFIGIGHYLGRNHVVDFSLDWDLYPAMSLRYRYEFHMENPNVTWAPVVGVKIKAAPLPPFDNYLDKPDQVKSSFFFFGALFGFPLERSLLTIEVLYLTHQQAVFLTNFGLHFFL